MVHSIEETRLISEIQFQLDEYYNETSFSCRAQIGKMHYESDAYRNLSAFYLKLGH